MPFKKGESGNPSGRPKGHKNQKTILWEQLGDWFLNDGASKFITEVQKLEGKEFVQSYSMMIEFFKPKLQRSEISADIQSQRLDLFADYSKEDLFEIVHGRKPADDDF